MNVFELRKCRSLLLGKEDVLLESFALKICLRQLQVWVELRNNEDTLNKSIEQLTIFFEKNKKLLKVQKDFKNIFGRSLK